VTGKFFTITYLAKQNGSVGLLAFRMITSFPPQSVRLRGSVLYHPTFGIEKLTATMRVDDRAFQAKFVTATLDLLGGCFRILGRGQKFDL
jgi:hypothetical protein